MRSPAVPESGRVSQLATLCGLALWLFAASPPCVAQAGDSALSRIQSTSTGACSPIINSSTVKGLTFNCILGRQEYQATAAQLEERAAELAHAGYNKDAIATYDDLIKGLIVAKKPASSAGSQSRLADLLVKEAHVLLLDGQPEVARARLRFALENEPEHRGAIVEIQTVLRRLGHNLEAAQFEAADIFREAHRGSPLNSSRLTQLLGDFVSTRFGGSRNDASLLCEFFRQQAQGGVPDHACFTDPPAIGDALGKALVEALVSLSRPDYYGAAYVRNKARSNMAFRYAADLAAHQLANPSAERWLPLVALSNSAAYSCRTSSPQLEKDRAAAYAAAPTASFAPDMLRRFKTNLEYKWSGSRETSVMLIDANAWFKEYAPNCSYVLPRELTSGIVQ
jgi:hypothetical protein